ncbi:hypothetical protein Bpfe_025596 [Biomphalaria pfeifferi]|uniref:Uncharacterized protein n=1 Tax=Biomphalaria pfeifferi TaxID=112525 RepID=A0AAD8EZF3_BIOPF|nr:hypothetical protein Bpfe_025596 [Biomphalaria pfeifferi]
MLSSMGETGDVPVTIVPLSVSICGSAVTAAMMDGQKNESHWLDLSDKIEAIDRLETRKELNEYFTNAKRCHD